MRMKMCVKYNVWSLTREVRADVGGNLEPAGGGSTSYGPPQTAVRPAPCTLIHSDSSEQGL